MEPIKHDLRLSETVVPFGVGAIVDIRGESLIAPDTSWWDRRYAPVIACRRLEDQLGSGCELRQAPAHAGKRAKDTPGLKYWRFPAWRFCERCTKLSKLTRRDKGKWVNKCECGGSLVPMRYVAVCEKRSHIQDIPWFTWAHRGRDAGVTDEVRFCRSYKNLRLVRSAKYGESLKSLAVRCDGCKRTRSLAELVAKDSLLRDGIKCNGTQPWMDELPDQSCECQLIAVQRGATSNYMAEKLSALDIPGATPRSVEMAAKVRENANFARMVADRGGPQAQMIAGWIAEELSLTPDEVLEIAAAEETAFAAGSKESRAETTDTLNALLDLKDGEWAAFVKKLERGRDMSNEDFVVDGWGVEPRPAWPVALINRLIQLGQVQRVREVTALRGFRRYNASAELICADLGSDAKRKPVYPAIEMFGEGIFLRFDEDVMSDWEQLPEVRARAAILAERRLQSPWARRIPIPEPRYIALHTLSHLLIRRLAHDSGYSSASLQERIYADSERRDRTCGILIYTAAGDAQGTLGGLVRLGHPDKLIPMLLAALDEADVCSNDPVCIESDRPGSSSMNLAACHGCALISETSCEASNRLLDRQMVLGGSDVPGFLGDVLGEVRSTLSNTLA